MNAGDWRPEGGVGSSRAAAGGCESPDVSVAVWTPILRKNSVSGTAEACL